ncbi:hypothetical protein TELCIR_17897 [Teladorsagia circumcincta]|uniref:Cation/H+ exchanger transmembrane domain-containing protein n=1 Tax=Teladorsagia circumcincta TaxID=45464 RepID=A0A2G9TRG0_TELCI|nr:hypothetical protein TELCIR_17897 [Teladorsagia circumcincta]
MPRTDFSAVLGAVSPAVVIPALLDASKAGYGVRAGVPSLVIAAASLDDVYAITIFSLSLSLLFPSDGAGAIAVLVAAFVAGHSWKKEGPLPEEDHLANLWHLAFQPLLFGLIGFELSFEMVQSNTILFGCLVLGIGLTFRFIASFLAVFGTSFTMRERLFVAVAWLPKATVQNIVLQAALAPVVLDMARSKGGIDPSYVDNGVVIFTIAVLSILITAPLGASLIRLATPLLLTKDQKSNKEAAEDVDGCIM